MQNASQFCKMCQSLMFLILLPVVISPLAYLELWHFYLWCFIIWHFYMWHFFLPCNNVIVFNSVFSSPEHKVLMVSFCDRPMSSVRNFFKHLLLLNHWANLDETWQGWSFGEALPKLFKRLNSNHNSGCHGNQNEKKIAKSLKIFFSECRRHRALIFSM